MMTLTEKILARAAGRPSVRAGDEVWATVDRMIMNDSSGPRRLGALVDDLGGLWDASRVVVVSDHFVPASTIRHAEIVQLTRRWAAEQRVGAFHESDGILHSLVLQKWLVRPGMLLVGADSHTVSAGAAAAVAVAIGSTELATVLATGQVWLRVPETIRVDLDGALGPRVDLRDVTMALLGAYGGEWAGYRALEYGGSFVEALSLEERLVLSNQGIEMGAKNAIVVPTARLRQAFEAAGLEDVLGGLALAPDEDANYRERRRLDVSTLPPQVALHPSPDRVAPSGEVGAIRVDQAWIGSCVGGRHADLKQAAALLEGRRVRVPLSVTPSTRAIYDACLADGTLATLVAAGATVLPPGCGACAGVHGGVLAPGERVIATGTRNFRGRMGSLEAEVYLGSAGTVAAAAVAGHIVDPRELD
jgi:3-isopropylmalate/(R)-2-methylmalate dehydratase large subunit